MKSQFYRENIDKNGKLHKNHWGLYKIAKAIEVGGKILKVARKAKI